MMHAVACIALLVGANLYDDEFAKAAKAYEAGNYAAAIDSYERLVSESVVDESLLYNLGNAYYRAGRLGGAIANYERALQLNPGFENARENLEKAVRDSRQHLGRPLPSDWEQSLLFWHYSLSRQATTRLALLTWVLLWVVLGLRQVRPMRYTRRAAAVLAVLAIAFGGSAWVKAHARMLAVADVDPTPVRYGTNESDVVRFQLYPGDRVTVDQQSNGWARVETANGERGWTQSSNLVFVGPPYAQPNAVAPAPKPSAGGEVSK